MSEELTTTQNDVPDYLKKYASEYEGDKGVGDLKNYIRPTYLRIVQGIGDLSEIFPPGTVVKMPSKEKMADATDKLLMTPVFWYKEYGLWHHINAKQPTPIVDGTRSVDPQCEGALLIQKAIREKNFSLLEIPYDDPKMVDPKTGTPLMMTWKESIVYCLYCHNTKEAVVVVFNGGEHFTGRNFGELIALRKEMPLWAGIYAFTIGLHKSKRNPALPAWRGFNTNNAGWASEEQLVQFEQEFKKFKEAFDASQLEVDLGQAADTDAESTPEASAQF